MGNPRLPKPAGWETFIPLISAQARKYAANTPSHCADYEDFLQMGKFAAWRRGNATGKPLSSREAFLATQNALFTGAAGSYGIGLNRNAAMDWKRNGTRYGVSTVISSDSLVSQEDGSELPLIDTIPSKDNTQAEAETRIFVSMLTETEKRVLSLRLCGNTESEILKVLAFGRRKFRSALASIQTKYNSIFEHEERTAS